MNWFRVARDGPTRRHVVTTLLQTSAFWTVFLVLLPWAIHAATTGFDLAPTPFAGHRVLGIALFIAGSTLGLASGLHMAVRGRGTPLPLCMARELVVTGPYRHIRNPMATAGIAQGTAVGLFLGDWFVVGYALAGAVLWHTIARAPEERDLAERFGDAYRGYRDAVPLWRPRLRGYGR